MQQHAFGGCSGGWLRLLSIAAALRVCAPLDTSDCTAVAIPQALSYHELRGSTVGATTAGQRPLKKNLLQ